MFWIFWLIVVLQTTYQKIQKNKKKYKEISLSQRVSRRTTAVKIAWRFRVRDWVFINMIKWVCWHEQDWGREKESLKSRRKEKVRSISGSVVPSVSFSAKYLWIKQAISFISISEYTYWEDNFHFTVCIRHVGILLLGHHHGAHKQQTSV